MLQAQVDPTAAATTQVELKQLADELAQLREEHAEVSGIYISAQQERDTATALVQKLEATIADLETSQAQEVVRLEAAVAALQAGQITAAEEVATAMTAREAAETKLSNVQTTMAARFDSAKSDIKAAKTEAKSQRKARQRIETEISELAEAVAIERAQFAARARELDTVEDRHAAEVQELRESLKLMRQLDESVKANHAEVGVQCDESWPTNGDGGGDGDPTSSRPRGDSDAVAEAGTDFVDPVDERESPQVLESSAWCSWERASVRRRARFAEDGQGPTSPTESPSRPLPRKIPVTPHGVPAVLESVIEGPPDQWSEELEQKLGQKDEEIKFLQRALMKNVELAAITKKEENELRKEYKTCKNQLDLLVALENEDEEAAAKLRQDIVTAKYRSTQIKLTKELREAQQQIVDLQEMVMLQRQVRFDRARSVSPTQAASTAAPGLRTVRLEREPGRQLGIMLNEDPDGHFKELGVRVAGVRKGSIADESTNVYMGDAIVWINDVWCFRSSFREVINYMKGSGDLVTIKLASAIDIGNCTGAEAFLQPGGGNLQEDEFDGVEP